jgi:hypothetical protein
VRRTACLGRDDKEMGQRGRVERRGQLAARLAAANRLGQDAFHPGLVVPEKIREDGIARVALQIRAQQEAPALVLLARFGRDVEQEFRDTLLHGRRCLQQPLRVGVRPVPVVRQRLQIQGALVAEGVVETLPGDAHRLHQRRRRRLVVSPCSRD